MFLNKYTIIVVNIFFHFLLVAVWLLCMATLIMLLLWIIQIGFKEILGVDIFVKIRERYQIKYAPRAKNTVKETEDTFYIAVPKKIVSKVSEQEKITSADLGRD